MTVRRRVLIRGRVQGVGFRVFAAREARRDGIAGWVRNLRDGGVDAEVEGDEAAVERMLAALREGPPGAVVEHVTVEELEPTGEDVGFDIRR